MHHFVTEMCTFLLQNGALWDIHLMHCRICEMVLLLCCVHFCLIYNRDISRAYSISYKCPSLLVWQPTCPGMINPNVCAKTQNRGSTETKPISLCSWRVRNARHWHLSFLYMSETGYTRCMIIQGNSTSGNTSQSLHSALWLAISVWELHTPWGLFFLTCFNFNPRMDKWIHPL